MNKSGSSTGKEPLDDRVCQLLFTGISGLPSILKIWIFDLFQSNIWNGISPLIISIDQDNSSHIITFKALRQLYFQKEIYRYLQHTFDSLKCNITYTEYDKAY